MKCQRRSHCIPRRRLIQLVKHTGLHLAHHMHFTVFAVKTQRQLFLAVDQLQGSAVGCISASPEKVYEVAIPQVRRINECEVSRRWDDAQARCRRKCMYRVHAVH